MRSGRGFVLLAVALVILSGCHVWRNASTRACHESRGYTQAQSVAPLKIPPGLDAPDTSSALRLPELKEPAPPPRSAKDPCLDTPPSFKVPQVARTPQA